jgi:hypothetical protein
MPHHIRATLRVCNLAIWRSDASTSKNDTALAKTSTRLTLPTLASDAHPGI